MLQLFVDEGILNALPDGVPVELSINPYIDVGTDKPLISGIQRNILVFLGKNVCDKKDWYAFGANKESIQNMVIIPDKVADMGFIISSSALILSEGEREIDIQVNLEKTSSRKIFWSLLEQIAKNKGVSLDIAFADVLIGWTYGIAAIGLIFNFSWGYTLAWIPGVVFIYHALFFWVMKGNQNKSGNKISNNGFRVTWFLANLITGFLAILIAL